MLKNMTKQNGHSDNPYAYTVLQNLKDAGCNTDTIDQFMKSLQKGDHEEQLLILSLQRRKLLDIVHAGQKQIDCLDYLVYRIEHKKDAI